MMEHHKLAIVSQYGKINRNGKLNDFSKVEDIATINEIAKIIKIADINNTLRRCDHLVLETLKRKVKLKSSLNTNSKLPVRPAELKSSLKSNLLTLSNVTKLLLVVLLVGRVDGGVEEQNRRDGVVKGNGGNVVDREGSNGGLKGGSGGNLEEGSNGGSEGVNGGNSEGGESYVNRWAVEIEGGLLQADRVASLHGFVNLGQVQTTTLIIEIFDFKYFLFELFFRIIFNYLNK